MQQEVVLAMLAKEPSQGYQLRARMNDALGPLGEALNAGQVYVTLGRLEKAGLVAVEETPEATGPADRDRKVYVLTAAGQQRVAEWLAEVSWPKPDLAEFHLKLIAAAAAGLADPIGIVDAQRRELLRRLRDAQRAAMAEPDGSDAALLLEGIVLRLQADLRWLEACEANWTDPEEKEMSGARNGAASRSRAAQGLRQGRRARARRRRGRPGRRHRRDPGGDGAERMREVDAAAPARRPRPAVGGRAVAGRQAHRPAQRAGARRLRRGEIGFVFQAFHLMDELTARENIELPALLAGRSPRAGPAARR